jgi:Bardet-Biedl syndrome 4 protein
VGLCFFGKQRYVASIACLKRALYLGPFEWIVCYNLGLVYVHTQQYAAAFNSFSAAINLQPSFASSYMYLGVTLARLGDMDNACQAYERAVEKDSQDALLRLNYGAL